MKTANSKLRAPEKFQTPSHRARIRTKHLMGETWCFSGVWCLLFGVFSCLADTNSAAPDEIPPLRPPHAQIPPSFWEQYGLWVVIGSVAVLALVGATMWLLTRPKPPTGVPVEVEARRLLKSLLDTPEDGMVFSWVSQVLRRYVTLAFDLRTGELTTGEFCRVITNQDRLGPELSSAISEFLRRCDERKFAPSPPQPGLGAAKRALELVELG